jgi:hypothetical protein
MSEADEIRRVEGPVVPAELFRTNIGAARLIYSVQLDSGLVVTNPDQFPVQRDSARENRRSALAPK